MPPARRWRHRSTQSSPRIRALIAGPSPHPAPPIQHVERPPEPGPARQAAARHLEVGPSYRNLGVTYQELGKHHGELERLSKSLDINTSDKHPDVAKSNIGNVLLQKADFKNALIQLKKGLDVLVAV